jgi:cell division protease FtsH
VTEQTPKQNDPGKNPFSLGRLRFSIWYGLAAMLLILAVREYTGTPVKKLTYREFLTEITANRVEKVGIGVGEIEGTFRFHPDSTATTKTFTTVPVEEDKELLSLLEKHGVAYKGVVPSPWPRLISWVLPMAVLIGLWFFIIRRMSGGASGGMMSIGKSKAKVYVETDTKVTFADIAGIDEAQEEVREVVEFLQTPDRFKRLGGRIPKGVLLVGPPGTGKTLLARAVAGESGVPFFSISGSDFVEMFVGVGAARVRDLFQQAKDRSPCIVFIDELDALGKSRGGNQFGSHDEREQTLNQLLVEMDGFEANTGVILMAATNRPETLDNALLRPGRFDRQIVVDRPDVNGREQILMVHAREITLGDDVDLHTLAARTPGMVGADLANVINEAALLAARKGRDAVGMEDFNDSIDRVIGGLERKSRVLNEMERKIISYHEAGHALVSETLPNTDPVHRISIIPRGVTSLGQTMYQPTEDRYLMSKEELEDRIAVTLGGRVTEEIIFDEVSTSAGQDFQRATQIAQHMVKDYGMSRLGLVSYADQDSMLGTPQAGSAISGYSEETAAEIDEEVRLIVSENYDRSKDIIGKYRDALHVMADTLMEKEFMLGEEVRRLLREAGVPVTHEEKVKIEDEVAVAEDEETPEVMDEDSEAV